MLKIENKAESNAAEIYINGEIIDNKSAAFAQMFNDEGNYAWPADLKKQLEEVLKKRDELSTKLAEAQREYNRKFCERKPLSANEFLEAMSKLFW